MRRSMDLCGPVHHRARPGAAGLLIVALTLASCGIPPDIPAGPTPTPSSQTTTARPASATPTPSAPVESPTTNPADSPHTTPTPSATAPGSTATPTPTKSSILPAPRTSTPAPATTRPPTPTATSTAPTAPTAPSSSLVQLWAGVDIEAFPIERRVVALTFDGGASAQGVSSILDTLDARDVPATFFVTGAFARAYPQHVTAIDRAGHPVGNHSNTHPYFTQITNEAIRGELAAAERDISALTGATTKPLFRFPFGDVAALDIRVVNEAGYIPIRWTVDTLGWKGTSEGITTAIVRQRILDRLRPGQIVLMHVGANPNDNSTLDADALPGIIDDLRARGYSFTTVPDLLDDGR